MAAPPAPARVPGRQADRDTITGARTPGRDRGADADLDEIRIDPLFSGTREIRTGRRAGLRGHLSGPQRMRTFTVVVLVLAVIGAPLGFYALREAARDPVFGDLAGLKVPGWAARDPRDDASGSRWCISQCRLRQRIVRSERSPEETSAVYTAALRGANWSAWKAAGCPPEDVEGFESCWQRDEYVMDLWIYEPECEVQVKTPEQAPGTPAGEVEAVCPPTVVAMKIVNRVSYREAGGA